MGLGEEEIRYEVKGNWIRILDLEVVGSYLKVHFKEFVFIYSLDCMYIQANT